MFTRNQAAVAACLASLGIAAAAQAATGTPAPADAHRGSQQRARAAGARELRVLERPQRTFQRALARWRRAHPAPGASPAGAYPPPESFGVSSATLHAIAACESGNDYATDTGNGFYGAYQFTLATWASVGGAGNPADAPPAEQDMRAAILYARSGPSPWPVCGQ